MSDIGDDHGPGDPVGHAAEEDQLLFHLPALCFPMFDIAHFVCAAVQLRAEHGHQFARQHPVSSCLAMLSSSFAGSVLTSLALGLPAVSPLQREDKVMLAVLVWLAIFFFPLDGGHRLVRNRGVFLLLSVMKEMYRVRKVVRGISLAQSHYPSSILIPFMVGVLKGNGSGLLKPLTSLICGVWRPEQSELLTPSLTTRCCAGAAVVWISGKLLFSQSQLHKLSGQLMYNSLVLMFVTIKVVQILDITCPTLKLLNSSWLTNLKKEESFKPNGKDNQRVFVINNNDKTKQD